MASTSSFIRPAEEGDFESLKAFTEGFGPASNEKDEYMRRLNHVRVLIEQNASTEQSTPDKLVGWIETLKYSAPATVTRIDTLAIHPDHRRRGHATALLQDAQSRAISERVETMDLRARRDNVAAVKLYEKFGFREAEQWHVNSTSVRMVKDLRSIGSTEP